MTPLPHNACFGPVLVLTCALLFGSCTPASPGQDPQGSPNQGLPKALLGTYQEQWGQATSQHRFEGSTWVRQEGGQFPRTLTMALLEAAPLEPGHYALVFGYTEQGPLQHETLRVDLWIDDNQTRWLCLRSPPAGQKASLTQAPADPEDLERRGCQGAPWRALKAQD